MSRNDPPSVGTGGFLDVTPARSRCFEIVETPTGLILHGPDENRTLNLNDCSRYIWESCNGTTTVGQMIDRIYSTFEDLGREVVQKDVITAVSRLAEAGALDALRLSSAGTDYEAPRYFYIVDQRPRGGLFSCLNRVLDYCYYCDHHGLVPLVWWGDRGCYWVDGGHRGATNVFEYYFEPMSGISLNREPNVTNSRWSGHSSFTGYESVVAPRGNNPKNLDFPKRNLGNQVIRKYLGIRPEILESVDSFVDSAFDDYTIGVHIRGPERRDGGSAWMRSQFEMVNGVPFELYFSQVRDKLEQYPLSKIFVATDSMMVKQCCESTFGSRMITIPHELSVRGNDHLKNKGGVAAAEIGENCLVDALILARTNYFVHGTSNVSNFVTCFNSGLREVNVYEEAFRKKGIYLSEIL